MILPLALAILSGAKRLVSQFLSNRPLKLVSTPIFASHCLLIQNRFFREIFRKEAKIPKRGANKIFMDRQSLAGPIRRRAVRDVLIDAVRHCVLVPIICLDDLPQHRALQTRELVQPLGGVP